MYVLVLLTLFDWNFDLASVEEKPSNYWRNIRVDTMTPEQIVKYFNWRNLQACKLAHYFGGKVHVIPPQGVDGQYPVCLDDTVKPNLSYLHKLNGQFLEIKKSCLVYSFGIHSDWSFDEAMEAYGCEVFSFDPSINETDHDHSKGVHFYNLGLGHKNEVNDISGWTLKTLDSIYEMLTPRHGATIIDYLKIDIEWNEWEVLKQILQSGILGIVRQLSVEFHLPNQDWSIEGSYLTHKDYRSLVKLVKNIEERMIRFESRANPWSIKRIKNLNSYHGPICFELSFYQVLPYEYLLSTLKTKIV